jgi:hypothetical protein
MNTQTQSWVAPRVSLYGVTGVPDAFMDGINPPGSGAYVGYPGYITQTNIDAEYAVSSPFTMTLNFAYSPNYDSVNVKCVYTCTQAVTMTTPKLQVAMTEQHIHFNTAPGSNGETDFYEVMRCMYPNGNGTTLQTTWAIGDKDSLMFEAKIPSYIYDKNQIAFVAFIQDNSTKAVKQACYCAPQQLPLDAAITAINNIPVMQCSTTFTPSIVLKNAGSNTLTSATINYKIDNGTVQQQAWTGSLASNTTTVVTLPLVTSTNGSHTDTIFVSNPNSGTDVNPNNNIQTARFDIALSGTAIPLTEGFTGTKFPPASWFILNPDGGSTTWVRSTAAGGFGHSSNSAVISLYDIPSGNTEDLVVAPIDLSGASRAIMTFSIAHTQIAGYTGSSYYGELQVLVSTDCDSTWNIVYDKSDPSLATAAADASIFTPTSSQWRTDTVNLNSYLGKSKVFISFHTFGIFSNNLFVDDINISQTAGINEITNPVNYLNVYPNPFSNNANIEFYLTKTEKASFVVYNLIGEKVLSVNEATYGAGTNKITINANDLSQGVYYLNAIIGNQKFTQKLTIVK